MPAIYDHRHVVRPDEIDEHGHANNVRYVAWMQSAAIAHSSAQGWTPERYRGLGCGWVARSHSIEYLAPAFAGDELVIRTWVADFRKTTSLRRYRMIRASDGAVLARAETNWAFVDIARAAPRRILPEVGEAFEIVASEPEEHPG
ncbi:MAG TPA: acyl-CoA thioesterase [Planctomycetaceae bacterium]|nr:acyl-CoA thioesterase [Planctomycetaceae bacterium]